MKIHYYLLILFLFSCTKKNITFQSSYNSSDDIIYISNAKIEKSHTIYGKLMPSLVAGTTMFFILQSNENEINPKTGEEFSKMNKFLGAGIGLAAGVYIRHLVSGTKKIPMGVNDVNEKNINTWWKLALKKDSRFQKYQLTYHNNNKFVKNGTIVAVRKDNFKNLSSLVIKIENDIEEKYHKSLEMTAEDWVKAAVIAYVGYRVVKEAINPSSNTKDYSTTNDIINCKLVPDQICEECKCFNFTCHTTGKIVRVKLKDCTSNQYEIGAGSDTQLAVGYKEMERIANEMTNCNCK